MEQWPIPGLLESPHGSLMVGRGRVWGTRRHFESVTDCKVYVHQSDSSIQLLPEVDEDKKLVEDKRIDLNPVMAKISVEGQRSIGYKLIDLRARTEASALVTSSEDLSVCLWKFALSTAPNMPITYAHPQPVRKFTFSAPPSCGLCFSPTSTDSLPRDSLWRLTAAVNGAIITCIQGSKGDVFRQDPELLSEVSFQKALGKAISAPPVVIEKRRGERLDMMSVTCVMNRPSEAAMLNSRTIQKNHGLFSWQTLDYWHERTKKEGGADSRIPTQYTLDKNLSFDGVDARVAGAGHLWEQVRNTHTFMCVA